MDGEEVVVAVVGAGGLAAAAEVGQADGTIRRRRIPGPNRQRKRRDGDPDSGPDLRAAPRRGIWLGIVDSAGIGVLITTTDGEAGSGETAAGIAGVPAPARGEGRRALVAQVLLAGTKARGLAQPAAAESQKSKTWGE